MLKNAFICSALLWGGQAAAELAAARATAPAAPSSSSSSSSGLSPPHQPATTAAGGEEEDEEEERRTVGSGESDNTVDTAVLRGSVTAVPPRLHHSPLELLLFPNRTKTYDHDGQLVAYDQHGRKLRYDAHGRLLSFPGIGQYPPDKYATTVPCEICAGLQTCTALNGLLIQEVYYPQFPGTLGTCKILDQRGERFALDVFGPDKTFRDSPTCRNLVLQVSGPRRNRPLTVCMC